MDTKISRSRRTWLAAGMLKGLSDCSLPFTAFAALAAMPARAAGRPTVVLVLGDSLSAELGLARGSGWVALLDKRLAERKIEARVVNASVSGETTAGGLSRLPALLAQHKPTHVIVELGANDALRGLPLPAAEKNLAAIARAAKAAGAQVVIVGMQVPSNYGRRYTEDFFAIFARVAQAEGTALVPFLLKGVADAPDWQPLFQADRIHPLAAAHPTLLDNVWVVLGPMLQR